MRSLLLAPVLLLAISSFASADDWFVGDLDQLRESRRIRVLVVPSRTNFFISDGQPRGFLHDLLDEYGRVVDREMTVEFIPVAQDQLIPALIDGRGDIAAGITIVPQPPRGVVFTEPYLTGVNEIVVSSKSAQRLATLEDLSGRQVHVVKGSAAQTHLLELSADLQRRGRKAIQVVEARESLAAEDLLELVNAAMIDHTVIGSHIASIWAQVLPNLSVREELVIHRDDQLALAVRGQNPKLLASLNEFVQSHRKGTLVGNELFRHYFAETKWLENPLSDDPLGSLRKLEAPFRRYAAEYGFDWLFLAAQGFQESRLNQSAHSSAGAVGVMQLEPATAREMGFANVATNADENIHAGAKYMAEMLKRYDEGSIAPADRLHFALAAYNAGPGNVHRWREIARTRGLDPNKWLGSVERISLERVGEQTYRYVRNIEKYYVAYGDWQRIQSERQVDVRDAGK